MHFGAKLWHKSSSISMLKKHFKSIFQSHTYASWTLPVGIRPKHESRSRRSSVFDAVEKAREATIKQVKCKQKIYMMWGSTKI